MSESPIVHVVDDDPSLRRSVRNLLRSAGYRVETFEAAEAFLACARESDASCLILDLRMPGMSGIELLTAMAIAHVQIPAVVLTAHEEEAFRDQALAAGARAFLTKPFQAGELLDAIALAMKSRS
jgi:FixJ family two-component response regulator